jgi:SAM-dependent methyltransferase
MTTHPVCHNPEFAVHVADYDAALARGQAVSGDDKLYFVRGRLAWLAACLRQLGEHPTTMMDYGGGLGSAPPAFRAWLGVTSVVGTDMAPRALAVARRADGSERARLLRFDHDQPNASLDLVYSNGVFHHILPHARVAAVASVARALRPGGLWAFWENNPWNPGTRYVMHRIPFDRAAIPLTPPEARRLLQAGGFEILRTDFLFLFPPRRQWLRGLEARLTHRPLGAQYQVLCRRPDLKRGCTSSVWIKPRDVSEAHDKCVDGWAPAIHQSEESSVQDLLGFHR